MARQRKHLAPAIVKTIAILVVAVAQTGNVSHTLANVSTTASGVDTPQDICEPDPVCRPAPKPRPVICDLFARLYGGYLIVTGTVQNLTGDPDDWSVSLTGSILGTTRVRNDGDFVYATHYDYSYGEVCARALGPNGEESLRVIVEFYE